MRWKPNSTVATIVYKDGRFLFVEEDIDGERVFNQPAGHLEENETLIEAAVRESLEETGWTVEVTHYMGLYVYHAPNGVTYHRHCFAAQAITYDASLPLDTGIIGAKWLTIEELIATQSARSPLVIKCAQDYLDNKRYPLDMIYEHPIND